MRSKAPAHTRKTCDINFFKNTMPVQLTYHDDRAVELFGQFELRNTQKNIDGGANGQLLHVCCTNTIKNLRARIKKDGSLSSAP
jgi:hypothetical protein